MAMEIDEAIIRVDNHAEIDEVEPIEISDDEARRVRLYENFYQVNAIDPALYAAHDVKRGLRNADGTGVLAGMTNISNVHGYVMSDGEKMPAEGSLRLRGYDLYDLLGDLDPTRRFAFEEVAYLLLMGELPTQERLNRFVEVIDSQRELPDGFTASTLMVDTSPDLMNMMARSILRLYAADESAEDRSPEHEIHTALSLISRLPRIMVLAYYAKQAAFNHESMIMHRFVPGQSTAETILSMLRPDRAFAPEEARMLDIMLCLHAEHGGGNNSTFTMHVVTSSGTDTYSAVAASLASLKGPKHGGANIKVVQMFEDMKQNVRDWTDEEAVEAYLRALLHREAFDRAGLIYGMGHAVYSLSDPRANVFKHFVEMLSEEKGRHEEYALYAAVARLAPKVIGEERKIYKGVSANIDFYSGFVYSMLDLPLELYTPIFAISRIAGWSAHRIEELINAGKIIRPAYKSVKPRVDYVPLHDRK